MSPTALDLDALGQRLQQAGLRNTRAVLAVAASFAAAAPGWSPTHAEVADRLARTGETVNHVTLYRLLHRLVTAGLLARYTPLGERVWRFRWQGTIAAAPPCKAVPYFECDECHVQFPLDDTDAPTQTVADALHRTLAEHGHQVTGIDLAVHGTCARCLGEDFLAS